MTKQQITLLNKYAALKVQSSEIEQEIKNPKEEVQKIVFKAEGEKVTTNYGVFEMRAGRKVWKYTDELLSLEKQAIETIKHKKNLEEMSGKAELVSAGTNLVFTAKKD